MRMRNWIEKFFGKNLRWSPVPVGRVGGRMLYAIDFEDATTLDCFVDFEHRAIELY